MPYGAVIYILCDFFKNAYIKNGALYFTEYNALFV